MKSKTFEWTARSITVLLVLAAGAGAVAENPKHKVFSGLMNAYSPQTTAIGPYEIRGPWSLALKDNGNKADFTAELNMELSDGWVITMNKGNFDPMARGAHTHHIVVCDGDVTPIANGFRVTGNAKFTKDGGPAPASIEPSAVVIEVTGGTEVEFSNMTLTFFSSRLDAFRRGSTARRGAKSKGREIRLAGGWLTKPSAGKAPFAVFVRAVYAC